MEDERGLTIGVKETASAAIKYRRAGDSVGAHGKADGSRNEFAMWNGTEGVHGYVRVEVHLQLGNKGGWSARARLGQSPPESAERLDCHRWWTAAGGGAAPTTITSKRIDAGTA